MSEMIEMIEGQRQHDQSILTPSSKKKIRQQTTGSIERGERGDTTAKEKRASARERERERLVQFSSLGDVTSIPCEKDDRVGISSGSLLIF
jgi:hypothetical protein